MSYRADPNLIPGMGYLLMIMLIVLAFQAFPVHEIALPTATNADPQPPAPNEIVLRVHASGLMELTIDDEWGTSSGWSYQQPRTFDELERDLGRLYMNRTEDRVLILKADTSVAFGVIEQIVLASRAGGVRVLRAVVEGKSEPGMSSVR